MTDTTRYVVAINRGTQEVITSDNQIVPITDWFCDGEPCEPDVADSAIVGPYEGGSSA